MAANDNESVKENNDISLKNCDRLNNDENKESINDNQFFMENTEKDKIDDNKFKINIINDINKEIERSIEEVKNIQINDLFLCDKIIEINQEKNKNNIIDDNIKNDPDKYLTQDGIDFNFNLDTRNEYKSNNIFEENNKKIGIFLDCLEMKKINDDKNNDSNLIDFQNSALEIKSQEEPKTYDDYCLKNHYNRKFLFQSSKKLRNNKNKFFFNNVSRNTNIKKKLKKIKVNK